MKKTIVLAILFFLFKKYFSKKKQTEPIKGGQHTFPKEESDDLNLSDGDDREAPIVKDEKSGAHVVTKLIED